jgi:peptidoglycan lytic transglycosylase F
MKKSVRYLFYIALLLVFNLSVSAGKGRKQSRFRTMAEIRQRGYLRVVTTKAFIFDGLPRRQTPRQYETALLYNFAKRLKLKLKYVYVGSFDDVLPALLEGRGDIAADNITITASRMKHVMFSTPIAVVSEHIVARGSHPAIRIEQLKGKMIIVTRGSSYVDSMQQLIHKIPGIKMHLAVKGVSTETLVDMVGHGRIPYIVADSNFLDTFQSYRSDVKSIYKFPDPRYIALALHPEAVKLREALNFFLKLELPVYQQRRFIGDLDQIKKRGFIRVLTRNNPVTYFLHRGHMTGFEYSLAKTFADEHKLRLVMVTPPDNIPLENWLLLGRGDLIAAAVIKPEDYLPGKMVFCEPYAVTRMIIIANVRNKHLANAVKLDNITILSRKNSAIWRFLSRMRGSGHRIKLVAAPEGANDFDLIADINAGSIDYAAVDELDLLSVSNLYTSVVKVANLGGERRYAWAVRKNDPKLKKAIDDFFKRYYRSTFYNLTFRKYFESRKVVPDKLTKQARFNGQYFSPYDSIIQDYAKKYYFPWCLIASQIYQESRFDPAARAWDGGMGLMQLMPLTAQEMGCEKPFDPRDNVRAGVGYMHKLRSRINEKIEDIDRTCFALASYNGGYGHLLDARKLAVEQKLDPNRWRNNVEKSYKLLSQRRYASRARYGFCRSDIITGYVNDILQRYQHYRQAVKTEKLKRKKAARQ